MVTALAGRWRWVSIAVAVVVLALIATGVARALTADTSEKLTATPTAIADRGEVTTAVATTGTVEPAQTRSLSFAVKGTVESISVRAGTTVTAGQVLATVDDSDASETVDDARQSLDDAEDALADAQDNAAKTSSTTSGCGSNAAAAYKSPTPDASPPATASASATASPSVGQTTPASTTPASTTSSPRATAATTAPPTGSASDGSSCDGQQDGTDSDQILSAEQRVNQATTALEEAEDALEGATITAPIAGKILTVSEKVGTQVSAGSTFITLAAAYDMQISADFPEADADRLAISQKGVVTLADRPGKEFKATVVQVDPTGTSDGTMVRYGVVLSFDEAPEDLLVGQSASVRVTAGSKTDVLRVPSTAVHDEQGDKGTVLKGGAQVAVGVGLRGDQYTEITSGLTDGDVVARSW